MTVRDGRRSPARGDGAPSSIGRIVGVWATRATFTAAFAVSLSGCIGSNAGSQDAALEDAALNYEEFVDCASTIFGLAPGQATRDAVVETMRHCTENETAGQSLEEIRSTQTALTSETWLREVSVEGDTVTVSVAIVGLTMESGVTAPAESSRTVVSCIDLRARLGESAIEVDDAMCESGIEGALYGRHGTVVSVDEIENLVELERPRYVHSGSSRDPWGRDDADPGSVDENS